MDLDEGKKLYSTYSEAKAVADKMCRSINQGFNAYKVGDMWAVGGVHTKSVKKKSKVNSFEDIRHLLDEFKDSEDDSSIEDFIKEVQSESLTSESSVEGESDEWILNEVNMRKGHEIGMSQSNFKDYLVLTIEKNGEEKILKMGGRFSTHIPLIKKQAESLKGHSVIWHTWNSKIRKTEWSSDSWFYLIEEKAE